MFIFFYSYLLSALRQILYSMGIEYKQPTLPYEHLTSEKLLQKEHFLATQNEEKLKRMTLV